MMNGFWGSSASRGNNIAGLMEVRAKQWRLLGFYGFLHRFRQRNLDIRHLETPQLTRAKSV